MNNESAVLNLLQALQTQDPSTYDAICMLAQDFYALYNDLNPPTGRVFGTTGQVGSVATPTGFTYTIYPNNLRLTWNQAASAATYELRYHTGNNTDWDTATFITYTTTLSADINPLTIPLIYGSYTFLLKARNSSGVESAAVSTLVTISVIDAPSVAVRVIDNNVLLSWSVPASSFTISHYNIYRGSALIGTVNSTFQVIFETSSGSYTYKVEAVDIVGNVGYATSVTVTVNQPPDFELFDDYLSNLSGTKVNVLLNVDELLCCISTTETYAEHFTSRGWASPQDQVDAGYPLVCEPTEVTGSYEEVIDYGVLLSSVIATVTWSTFLDFGSVTVAPKLAGSTDGVNYSAWVSGDSAYFQSIQYLKVHFDFTGANDKSLIEFYDLRIRLDVKREIDSGSITALKTDANGTEVTFNKPFKDIDSITLTVAALEPVTAIYDFTDIPNPVHFYVFAFDSTGNRITYPVSWKCRGIV